MTVDEWKAALKDSRSVQDWKALYQQKWDMSDLWKLVDDIAKAPYGEYHLPRRFGSGDPEVNELYERCRQLHDMGLAESIDYTRDYPFLRLTKRGIEAARQGQALVTPGTSEGTGNAEGEATCQPSTG